MRILVLHRKSHIASTQTQSKGEINAKNSNSINFFSSSVDQLFIRLIICSLFCQLRKKKRIIKGQTYFYTDANSNKFRRRVERSKTSLQMLANLLTVVSLWSKFWRVLQPLLAAWDHPRRSAVPPPNYYWRPASFPLTTSFQSAC